MASASTSRENLALRAATNTAPVARLANSQHLAPGSTEDVTTPSTTQTVESARNSLIPSVSSPATTIDNSPTSVFPIDVVAPEAKDSKTETKRGGETEVEMDKY